MIVIIIISLNIIIPGGEGREFLVAIYHKVILNSHPSV